MGNLGSFSRFFQICYIFWDILLGHFYYMFISKEKRKNQIKKNSFPHNFPHFSHFFVTYLIRNEFGLFVAVSFKFVTFFGTFYWDIFITCLYQKRKEKIKLKKNSFPHSFPHFSH